MRDARRSPLTWPRIARLTRPPPRSAHAASVCLAPRAHRAPRSPSACARATGGALVARRPLDAHDARASLLRVVPRHRHVAHRASRRGATRRQLSPRPARAVQPWRARPHAHPNPPAHPMRAQARVAAARGALEDARQREEESVAAAQSISQRDAEVLTLRGQARMPRPISRRSCASHAEPAFT